MSESLSDPLNLWPNANVSRPKPKDPEDRSDWTILQLFDALLPYFMKLEEGEALPERSVLLKTWIAWRVFLAAVFAVACPVDEPDCPYPGVSDDAPRGAGAIKKHATNKQIYETCTGRSTWPTKAFREVCLVVGRRGGKSFIVAIIGIYLAVIRKYKLGIGEKGMVQILARDKDQARVIRNYIVELFLNVPLLRGYLKGDPTQKLIELTNGIVIEVRAASDAGVRGYTVVGALLDEIAFWAVDDDKANTDKKILRAIRPAMSRVKGSLIVMLSSPYAEKGEFFESYAKGYAKDDERRSLVWQADTFSMHPTDDAEIIEEIAIDYEKDPESASAEYGANFRSDLQDLFSRVAVEAVVPEKRIELPRVKGISYRAFVDPSGGSSDSYTMAIAHTDRLTKKEVLDCVREWKPRFSPEGVTDEICTLVKSYGVHSVTGDRYAGEWPREQFRKRSVTYELSTKDRSELYLAALPKINAATCELLDNPKLINQLAALKRRTGGTGKDKVDHPRGQHDDVANAVAGVLVMSDVGQGLRVRNFR